MFFTKIVPYIYDTTDINGIVNIPDIFDNIPNTHSTPTILETAVLVVCSQDRVRSKSCILNLIRRTQFMVVRPKTFLRAFEVDCVRFWVFQKVLKIMEFGSLRESVIIARV